MKRKLFIFLLFFSLCTVKVNAQDQFDARINLLNMANIEMIDAKEEVHPKAMRIKTKMPISVVKNKTYTFIVDEKFFYSYLEYGQFEQWSFNNGAIFGEGIHYESSLYGNWVCLTFTANENTLSFTEVIVDNTLLDEGEYPFKMMLFEGTMNDFLGYYTYGSNFVEEEGYLFVDADYQYSVEEIENMITVTDNRLSTVSTVFSSYMDKNPVGQYYMRFEAKDSSMNYNFFKLNIRVVDVRPPLVDGKNVYQTLTHETVINYDEVKNNLTVFDTQDSHLNNKDLELIENTYATRENIPGKYHLTYRVKDTSNNVATYVVAIDVVDRQGPIISGPKIIYRDVDLGLMSNEEVLEMFKANDLVEGSKAVYIKKDNQEVAFGKTEVIVESKDSKNNITSHTLIVVFVDNTAPTFLKNTLVLSYDTISNMSDEDIKNWILSQINIDTDITILHNEALYSEEGTLYYSYMDEGIIHYGQIIFKPNNASLMPSILIGSVILVNIAILFFHFKKKRY